MKKVLILAYDFPPYVSVGGMRPKSWHKYLSQNGLYPVVVTRQWNNQNDNALNFISSSEEKKPVFEENEKGLLIKTPYFPNLSNRLFLKYGELKFRIVRKAISAFYEYFQYLFFIGPKMPLYVSAKKYLSENDVDLILVTGEPFILFKYASQLSRDFNVPWVADYRDPWSQNKSRGNNFLRTVWDNYFEKKYLKNVNGIITVSEHFKKKIAELLPNKNYHVIKTGFDSDAIRTIKNKDQNNKLMTIAFAGSVYEWHPLESFFKVLNMFLKERGQKDVQIDFYGLNESKFHSNVDRLINLKFPELKSFINIYPKLPNEELLEKISRANLFLLFNDYISVGTKIYDYIGLRRKIIFCYTKSEESEKLKNQYYNLDDSEVFDRSLQELLIEETQSGINIENEKHLKEVLPQIYREFKKEGKIKCESVGVDMYSQEHQVKLLSNILSNIIENSKDA